ncbi:hypothetical protein THICB3180053 [Thiomonas sp. CB3]|nr:hypothetical protein THICB3180053 [Thiomonas sp. CB3]
MQAPYWQPGAEHSRTVCGDAKPGVSHLADLVSNLMTHVYPWRRPDLDHGPAIVARGAETALGQSPA